MESDHTRETVVVHAGQRTNLLQRAVEEAVDLDHTVTVENHEDADAAKSAVSTADAVVVEPSVDPDWMALVDVAASTAGYVPTVVVVDDEREREAAFTAGAPNVVRRRGDGDATVIGRRLDSLLARSMAGTAETPVEARAGPDASRLTDVLLDTIDDVFYLVDTDGSLQRWNESLRSVSGYSDAELAEMNALDFFSDKDEKRVAEAIEEAIDTGSTTVEADLVTKDGETVPFDYTGTVLEDADGDPRGVVGVGRDISRRKELEAELREQANLLDHIFNQIPVALYVKDEEGRFVRKRNFEGDPEDFKGKTDIEFFGDMEYTRESYADDMRVIEEGERIINKEEYNPLNDEWVLTSKVPWRDEDGDIQGLIGVSRFITEKKEYERDLRLRNRAMEEAPIGITIYRAEDQTIQYANERLTEQTGYDRSSIEGGSGELLTGPETDDDAIEDLRSAFIEGDAMSVVTVFYRKDRTPFWGRVTIAPVSDEDGEVTHFVGFLQDVTDEKEYEQTIERRLDEFGDLLAQQLRPPLETASEQLEVIDGTAEADAVERATEAIERADQLVVDLAEVNTFSVKSRETTGTAASFIDDT